MFSAKLRQRQDEEPQALRRAQLATDDSPRILFHAASMGELEQCIPVVHALQSLVPIAKFWASCSSPSGYTHAQNLTEFTEALYSPIDTKINVTAFINAVRPNVVVINRYDVWPHFVEEVNRRGIPLHLMNATMPSAGKNILLGRWMKQVYQKISNIYAVSERDAEELTTFLGRNITAMPDTRVDRVLERLATVDESIAALRRADVTTLVVGSSWPADEDLTIQSLSSFDEGALRLIIVPHEPTSSALARIENLLPIKRLSSASASTHGHILVDEVGRLLSLYSIADAAFVGGGFGAGVHSVTEPAGYGIPIASGPKIDRSRHALTLQHAGALRCIEDSLDLKTWLITAVLDETSRVSIGAQARNSITDTAGSSLRYATMIAQSITDR